LEQSATATGAAMQRTLDRRSEGLQNIGIAVDNVDDAMEGVRARGLEVIKSHHSHSFFTQPKVAHGLLIQILGR
jgi:hypothetical protein